MAPFPLFPLVLHGVVSLLVIALMLSTASIMAGIATKTQLNGPLFRYVVAQIIQVQGLEEHMGNLKLKSYVIASGALEKWSVLACCSSP